MSALVVDLARRLVVLAALCGLGVPVWAQTQMQTQTQKYPDVVAVRVVERAAGVFDFDVTISSPYDSPARYADGFRVMGEDGRTVFGVRPLGHDHASEQPFTRDLYGVRVPDGVRQVVVQGRDQQHGWGGDSKLVVLPGR